MNNKSKIKSEENFDNCFAEKMTYKLAKRLGEDNYLRPFNFLQDLYLFIVLVINKPQITFLYTDLLE